MGFGHHSGLYLLIQALDTNSYLTIDLETWRPSLYAYVFWAFFVCFSGFNSWRAWKTSLFVLPAALFVISMVVFPLLFGLVIAFSDWNLSSPDGRTFNGLDNVRQMWRDPFYWNALKNMVWYTIVIIIEYAVAFGLAILLNSQIRARKFFRVAFLLPLMLSPVAVSWMIGKSMLEIRFGPVSRFYAGLLLNHQKIFQRFCTILVFILLILRSGLAGLALIFWLCWYCSDNDHGHGCMDLYTVYDDHDFGWTSSYSP